MDDGHLQLGITLRGIHDFIERLEDERDLDDLSFCRPPELQQWVRTEIEQWYEGQAVGGEEHPWDANRGLHIGSRSGYPLMTGYDFAEKVKVWLRRNSQESKSVCEVLSNEGSREVGRANCFYSHVQMPSIGQTLDSMEDGSRAFSKDIDSPMYFWLDYLTLRQCADTFDLPLIRRVISGIGCTLAEVTSTHAGPERYFLRSFCLFEAYATIEGGGKFLVNGKSLIVLTLHDGSERLDTVTAPLDSPGLRVDSSAARTRRPQDKAAIDDFIRSTIGFESLDQEVMRAMVTGTKQLQAMQNADWSSYEDSDDSL